MAGNWYVKFVPAARRMARAPVELAIAGSSLHPAIIPLRQALHLDDGAALLYDRVDGQALDSPGARERFYALPPAEKRAALGRMIDGWAAVGEAGWVLVDLYEGNAIYDFEARRPWIFDWDLCRPRPGFALEGERNYGSSRLMAPEELLRGAWIGPETNVFNAGKVAQFALPEADPALAAVLARATDPERSRRYPTLRAFAEAFSAASANLQAG